MKDAASLDEGYQLYKSGKMQRRDFMRQIVDAIQELQTRIGGVDEAAVDDVRKRVAAMETTIGNALIGAKTDEMRRSLIDRAPAPKSYLQQLAEAENGGDPQELSAITPELRGAARKPGRPKKEAA